MIRNISTYGVLCPIYVKLGYDAPSVQIKEPDTTNGVVFEDVSFSLASVPPGEIVVTGNFKFSSSHL